MCCSTPCTHEKMLPQEGNVYMPPMKVKCADCGMEFIANTPAEIVEWLKEMLLDEEDKDDAK